MQLAHGAVDDGVGHRLRRHGATRRGHRRDRRRHQRQRLPGFLHGRRRALRPRADPVRQAAADGQRPAGHRQSLVAHVEAQPRNVDARDRRARRLPVGHQRQARRAADPPPARHLQARGAGLFQHRLPRHQRGVRGGGATLPGRAAGPRTSCTRTASRAPTWRSAPRCATRWETTRS